MSVDKNKKRPFCFCMKKRYKVILVSTDEHYFRPSGTVSGHCRVQVELQA